MSETLQSLAEHAALLVEFVGVALIVVFVVLSLGHALVQVVRRVDGTQIVREARHRLARGILLGLELLVGADIIHTVAVDLSFSTVGVLAIVVAIRTFLSYSIEVELSGRWPWQSRGQGEPAAERSA